MPGDNRVKPKRRQKSSRQILAAAYKKSNEEEEREEKSSCGPFTLRSVPLFVILLSVILFSRSFLAFYTDGVLDNIQRRFSTTKVRTEFIIGVEKIGFIITLIFTAYYGRNLHKPLSILWGCVLCCIGAVLCCLPHFVCNEIPTGDVHNATSPMMRYLGAGLCQSGRNANYTFSHNQCDQILSVTDEAKAHSLLCAGKFLIGVGTAAYVTLGVVYISESASDEVMPLLLGVLLCMDGLGEFVASLMSWQIASHTEDLSGDVLYAEWDTTPWWLGFPVAACLFIIPCIPLLFFPKWINTPRWLAIRRRRRLRRLEEHLVEEDTKRRRRKKRKKRKEQQRKAETQRKQAVEEAAAHEEEEEEENKEEEDKEEDKEEEDKEEGEEEEDEEEHEEETEEDAQEFDDVATVPNPREEEEEERDVKEEEEKKVGVNRPRRVMIQDDRPTQEEFNDRFRGTKPSTSISNSKSGTKLGRQLRDLPQNLKYLLVKPEYPLVVLGLGLALYFPYAFHSLLPDYVQVQFLRVSPPHSLLIGITHSVGNAVGAFLGGFIVYKWKISAGRRQMSMVIGCLVCCTALLLVLLAGHCENQRFGLTLVDNSLERSLTACNGRCDCAHTERSPVCATINGFAVEFPSPCLAGCRAMTPGADSNQHTVYTDCLCDPSQKFSASKCTQSCKTEVLFYVVYTFASMAHSTGFVALVLFFLKFVSTKMRSLSLGFAVWLSSIIVLPGVTTFKAISSTTCLVEEENCLQEDECWIYDITHLRNLNIGTVVAFQAAALVCFVISWLLLWKRKHESRVRLPGNSDDENGHSNSGFQTEV